MIFRAHHWRRSGNLRNRGHVVEEWLHWWGVREMALLQKKIILRWDSQPIKSTENKVFWRDSAVFALWEELNNWDADISTLTKIKPFSPLILRERFTFTLASTVENIFSKVKEFFYNKEGLTWFRSSALDRLESPWTKILFRLRIWQFFMWLLRSSTALLEICEEVNFGKSLLCRLSSKKFNF